jgi:hypothetical protein
MEALGQHGPQRLLKRCQAGPARCRPDETGYTWRRSDAAILHMTKYGRYAAASGGTSYMSAFNGVLADRKILAIIAFIKAGWPIGWRIAQAMLTPGFAGIPAGANDIAWRLPPSCNAVPARSEARAQRPQRIRGGRGAR